MRSHLTSAAALLALLMPLLAAPAAKAETLQDVLASVYQSNPRLQAERARLREVDENYIQARAQGRVQVSASGQAARAVNRTPVSSSFFGSSGGTVDGTPYSGQLNVVQPLYTGGRVRALKRQAKASILAARAGLENAENNIFLAAANAYVDVIRDEQSAAIRRNNVSVLTRQLQAANERFNVGEGTRTDIAQSQSRLAQAEAGLAQADAQLEISRAQFRRIVGRQPTGLTEPPVFVLPPNLDAAMDLARDNNPQLLAAYYNEKAGAAAIDVAKAAGRPQLSLNGTVSGSRDQLLGISETDQAALTAQISIPIFSGGLNKSRVRQAKHAKTRLAYEARDTELAVDQTVAQVWAQIQAAREIVRTSRRQVEAAEIAFEGVDLEQQVGTRTQLDVLDAEQEVLNAKLSLVNAEREFDSATFQLLSVIGVFDADGIELPVGRYDERGYLLNVAYDGYQEAIDRYVPEVVQKIGPQLPNIVTDPIEVGVDLIGKTEIDNHVGTIAGMAGEVVEVTKIGIDALTLQDTSYDPRIDQPEPEIITEPYPGQDDRVPDVDEVIDLDIPDVPNLPIENGRLKTKPKTAAETEAPRASEPLDDSLQPFEGGR